MATVKQILEGSIPKKLVEALLDAYFELKENFFLGKLRSSELEGGRFSEVALRICQYIATKKYTPLSKKLGPFPKEVFALENPGGGTPHESIRIHIPRLLLSIYGIRNRRNVGHVSGDVNPNVGDAALVMTNCDWVLSELIRICYNCPVEEAQAFVEKIFERKPPLIQEFDGYIKVLEPKLSAPKKILAILYFKAPAGIKVDEIFKYLKNVRRNTISVALNDLENERGLIHRSGDKCFITRTGVKYAEENINLSF